MKPPETPETTCTTQKLAEIEYSKFNKSQNNGTFWYPDCNLNITVQLFWANCFVFSKLPEIYYKSTHLYADYNFG